jgi:hypothetical protein
LYSIKGGLIQLHKGGLNTVMFAYLPRHHELDDAALHGGFAQVSLGVWYMCIKPINGICVLNPPMVYVM